MKRTLATSLVAAALAVVTVAGPTAAAEPAVTSPSAGAGPSDPLAVGAERTLSVYSPSMKRTIPVDVLTAAGGGAGRPTLYLLNGSGGGEDSANWRQRTDVESFFADKNVNVVIPDAGAFSYYTDWQRVDPVLGRNEWTTFLTKELPPVVDSALHANGVNAIAGLSMAGTSVLNLAIDAPGLYRAVAAYSGCASTSDPVGQEFVRLVVERGGGDITNMWGPVGGPGWVNNDPYVNAERLRGVTLYLSSGNGLPGPYDTLTDPRINGNPTMLGDQDVVGGVIEAATNACTHLMVGRLATLGIPVTVDFPPTGTHSWGYWQDELHRSWPVIAAALGA
ncbi:esterase family protein [Rhodococcus spelaei]|uniref:Esterase family protein n=1 Tax=Rhodococcus spelaei TaxID=2546320 RepID=A0A541BMU0_9NOCA|nr:alpha/beta hydrolase family protein [Rhodococcus spelaei]TQF73646.1 esterase family protein [Rhodococcus spelaei]